MSLIVSVKRLIKAGSKIQGAAAAVCYGIFGVVAVFACGIGSEGMYQSMKKTALFSYIKTNFLSGSNPQVLYFLFIILLINFVSMHCWSFDLVVYFTYEQIDMRAKCSHIYQRKNEKTSIYNYTWQMALES